MSFSVLAPALTNSPTASMGRTSATSLPPPMTVGSLSSRTAPRTLANLSHLGRSPESSGQNALRTFQNRSRSLADSDKAVTRYTEIAHQPRYEPTPQEQFSVITGPATARAGGGIDPRTLPLGNDTGSQIVKAALGMIGTPYAWGGGGIGVRASRGIGMGTQNVIGVDCSGLTSYVFGKFGIKLPRHSNHQTQVGYRTSIKNARPGDIVGWARGGHVAIYAGGGKIIESPKPGSHVRVRSLHSGDKVFAVRIIR